MRSEIDLPPSLQGLAGRSDASAGRTTATRPDTGRLFIRPSTRAAGCKLTPSRNPFLPVPGQRNDALTRVGRMIFFGQATSQPPRPWAPDTDSYCFRFR